jgi:SET domain-containing protein
MIHNFMSDNFENNDILVKPSKIDGFGVFAKRDFTAGEVVLTWNPVRSLSETEILNTSLEEKKYISRLGNGTYVIIGIPGRYVNHSCDPNTKSEQGKDVAIKDITKGEEITADYRKEGALADFTCKCESKDCKNK